MTNPTRDQFLELYRAKLINAYEWANKPDALNAFIQIAVRKMDSGSVKLAWHFEGAIVQAVWRELGGIPHRARFSDLQGMQKHARVTNKAPLREPFGL